MVTQPQRSLRTGFCPISGLNATLTVKPLFGAAVITVPLLDSQEESTEFHRILGGAPVLNYMFRKSSAGYSWTDSIRNIVSDNQINWMENC